MRIRSIKPEFWRSPDISCLCIEDRLLFIGLWSYVDDNGVGEDRLSQIAADLFADDVAADPRETFARVSRGLARLHESGRIVRYSVAGRDFLEVVNWRLHQRIDKPGRPRFPRNDAEGAVIREGVARPREGVAPGTGEQGNRGTGELGNRGTREQALLSPDESDDHGTLIPDEWRPSQRHIDKATSLHLDVQRESQRFRESAARKQRRLKNWDTGFTNWLRKAAEFNQERQGRPAVAAQSKAARNAAEYRRIFDGHEGSIPAIDAGVGS